MSHDWLAKDPFYRNPMTLQGVNNVQTALTLRKSSINSIAATFVVVLALTAGGAGGYWLKGQVPSAVTMAARPPVAGQSQLTDAVDRAIARAANASRPADTLNLTDAVDRAISAARHAATEHAEAGALVGTDFALSAARHAASERAEAGTVNGLRP